MDTKAEVTLNRVDDGFAITSVHLTLRARIHNVDRRTFAELADKAKSRCPVSQLLRATITLDALLVDQSRFIKAAGPFGYRKPQTAPPFSPGAAARTSAFRSQ